MGIPSVIAISVDVGVLSWCSVSSSSASSVVSAVAVLIRGVLPGSLPVHAIRRSKYLSCILASSVIISLAF